MGEIHLQRGASRKSTRCQKQLRTHDRENGGGVMNHQKSKWPEAMISRKNEGALAPAHKKSGLCNSRKNGQSEG